MSKAAREDGAVAFQAEQLKRTNYTALESSHHFVPFAVETPSVLGQAALDFVQELGQRLHQATGDLAAKSSLYGLQHLSIAVHRGNAAAGLGTAETSSCQGVPF